MRLIENAAPGGGVRALIIGAGAYPNAKVAGPKVPKLSALSSAPKGALDLAERLLGPWLDRFEVPIATVDLLANSAAFPEGIPVTVDGETKTTWVPTLERVVEAKNRWLKDAQANDILLFYCCGHGVYHPATEMMFLPSDFGADEDDPWSGAIAIADLRAGLAEKRPRKQWLMFDACQNTPTQLQGTFPPRPKPLISGTIGGKKAAVEAYGPLEQVLLGASVVGEQAFGKEGRPSRFLEAFFEACDESAYLINDGTDWWADRETIERSISTFGVRVAEAHEQDYFTFARTSETDASAVPKLLRRKEPSGCTLIARSAPAHRFSQASLSLTCPPSEAVIGSKEIGSGAMFRQSVSAWEWYQVTATFPKEPPTTKTRRAFPPFIEVVF